MSVLTETGMFELGDLTLQSGAVIREAKLSWKSYGTLSPPRDNVIVYPTSYTATHADQEWLIDPDMVLDPTRWFIVTPNMFGNGLSSSPSNTPDYPTVVTSTDNVRAQKRLMSEQFGIERIAAVYGFSMGAQQAYHWPALFPDDVDRAIVVAGSARTSPHNKVFLLSLLATLEAAPEHIGNGRFSSEPLKALRAFSRNYAGWAHEPGLVSGRPASEFDRRCDARGISRRQMGAGLSQAHGGRPLCPGGHLASRRHQRQRALRR